MRRLFKVGVPIPVKKEQVPAPVVEQRPVRMRTRFASWTCHNDAFEMLKGWTFLSVEQTDDALVLRRGNTEFSIHHENDCCEDVVLDEVIGNLSDLIGSQIIEAESVGNDDPPKPSEWGEPESYTWTFIKLGTAKGFVTLRFYGESNGYYSETANLYSRTLA